MTFPRDYVTKADLTTAITTAIEASETRIINAVAGLFEQHSVSVNDRFESVDQRFDNMDQRLNSMDKRLDSMDKRLVRVENSMVTKSYLNDKLADLRGELFVPLRTEDQKVTALVTALVKEKSLRPKSGSQVLSIQPFRR